MGKRNGDKADLGQNETKSNDQAATLLLAKKSAVDPYLALLFASSAGPVVTPPKGRYNEPPPPPKRPAPVEDDEESLDEENSDNIEGLIEGDKELSSVEGDLEEEDALMGFELASDAESSAGVEETVSALEGSINQATRKRKRFAREDDLEGQYMLKIAKEEEKEEQERQAERRLKRQRMMAEQDPDMSEEEEDLEEKDTMEELSENDSTNPHDLPSDVPRHETLATPDKASAEMEKASRTVFLANVSTSAITSKAAKKTLLEHMASFLDLLPAAPDGKTKQKVESIRFRSTAYGGGGLPKKAAFATKSLREATTKSTNAYVVYSTSFAAREAVKRLNRTIVLDRHLRVDSVAHPARTDHRRCVFVGNLGFVDDESMIDQGGENERKRSRIPSDIEEGLWRQFGKAGKVESVRVVRDEKTRVGKGFAYVQFEDSNSVEAALLFHEKKYPPMLPRVLRVTRAKAMKKTERAEKASRTSNHTRSSTNPNRERIYNPKVSSQQQSLQGRASKLLGRAGAAQFRKADVTVDAVVHGDGQAKTIRAPESFVFEGYRASAKSGKPKDLKMGGRGGGGGGKKAKGKGRPGTRSSKRGTEWKKSGARKA